ncbi:MAG TPA: arsenate reductase ArsC [Nitrospira sp.]|nr:arsenate reductase ArsC [Nitrospira sp.]
MKPVVLFLCTGNSCRSQMAEGWLRHLAGNRFDALSAGTHPVGVNPRAIAVMAEAGVDITPHRSKHVEEVLGRQPDYVITVCDWAKDACPVVPAGTAVLHWSFADPAEAVGSDDECAKVFRRVRDEIARRIIDWLKAENGGLQTPMPSSGS